MLYMYEQATETWVAALCWWASLRSIVGNLGFSLGRPLCGQDVKICRSFLFSILYLQRRICDLPCVLAVIGGQCSGSESGSKDQGQACYVSSFSLQAFLWCLLFQPDASLFHSTPTSALKTWDQTSGPWRREEGLSLGSKKWKIQGLTVLCQTFKPF